MIQHHVPAGSTHTIELKQLQELNDRLAAPHDGPGLTAQALGLAGVTAASPHAGWTPVPADPAGPHSHTLPAGAVLDRVFAEGPPSFPYIWGRFRAGATGGGQPELLAPLHTQALIDVGRVFGLRQHWGL